MLCERVEVEAVNGMCCKVEYRSRDSKNADIRQTVEEGHDWQGIETKGLVVKCCRRTEHESKEHKSC